MTSEDRCVKSTQAASLEEEVGQKEEGGTGLGEQVGTQEGVLGPLVPVGPESWGLSEARGRGGGS